MYWRSRMLEHKEAAIITHLSWASFFLGPWDFMFITMLCLLLVLQKDILMHQKSRSVDTICSCMVKPSIFDVLLSSANDPAFNAGHMVTRLVECY